MWKWNMYVFCDSTCGCNGRERQDNCREYPGCLKCIPYATVEQRIPAIERRQQQMFGASLKTTPTDVSISASESQVVRVYNSTHRVVVDWRDNTVEIFREYNTGDPYITISLED